ncbi:MAG TPA: hypothetical protein VHA75_09150 [Rugosimonospora sp.]|nr:hypothetical protein [Rugosimonospora sp.]
MTTTTDSTGGFTDTTVTDRIARILDETEPALDCVQCWVTLRPCRYHQAEAVVNAMRAQELWVLTPEAGDEIVEHIRADERRRVAEEIAQAIEAAAEKVKAEAWSPTAGTALAAVVVSGADIARKFAAKGAER